MMSGNEIRENLRASLRLYGVTDRSWLRGETLVQQVEKALQGGVTFLQLREKQLQEEEFLEEALKIRELCSRYHVPFVIDDNVKVALRSGADGVHLGQADMGIQEARRILGEDKIIGLSARTAGQAVQAEKDGADYLGAGAVFGTSTKSDAITLPKGILKEICRSVSIPVVAIGGINSSNLLELRGTGISGAAVVSAIFAAEDIAAAARRLNVLAGQVTGL